jgi:hypothetical protein
VASLLSQPQGAVFHDTPAEFVLAARLLDLKSLSFGLTGESVGLTSELRSTPFVVDIASGAVDAAATITNLPEKTALSLNLDQGTLHFEGKDANDAPKPIGSITFEADAPASDPLFGSARKIRGAIVGVPAVLDVAFNQTGGTASLDANGGQIGEIAFIASSDPAAVLPGNDPGTPHDDQGVTFRDRGGAFEVAARVLGLRSLSATLGNGLAGGPVVLDAKTAGGIFDLDVATDDFVADGVIDKLPSDVKVTVDLDSGDVRFLGNTGIDRVALNADADTALVGRADKLDVLLEGLPADVAVKLSQTLGTAEVTSRDSGGAFASIDKIEVAAWNDSKELPAAGAQGAVYRDVNPTGGGAFRIGARILELEQLKVDFLDAVQLVTRTAGGPFSAVVQTADLTGNVQINDLPTELTLGVDLDAGTVNYLGNAEIGSIVASLESATPLFGDAKAFKVGLTGVPTAFTIVASPSVSNQLSLKATQGTIDKIEVQAGPTLATLPAFPGSVAGTTWTANDAGAFVDLSGGKFLLAARVFDLNELTVDLDPIKVTSKMATGRKFFVDAKIPSGASTIDADAIIDQLPSDMTIELADRADGGSDVKFSSNAAVARLYLKATGITLLPGVNDIEAEILEIPSAFTLALPNTGPMAVLDTGAAGNNSGDPAIGEVRLRAGSVATFPGSSTLDFIKYVDTPSSFGIGARVSGIRFLSATLSPIDLTLGQDPNLNAPIDVEADIQTAVGQPLQQIRRSDAAQPVISDPSSSTRVQVIQGAETSLIYTGAASSVLNGIRLKATNLAGLPKLDLRLTNIPSTLDVCFDAGPGCYRSSTVSGQSRPVGGSRNYQPKISIDVVTNWSGANFMTLNGAVNTAAGTQDITLENVRIQNLAFDLTQGDSQEICVPIFGPCANIPRVSVVLDSNGAPFLIGRIVYDSINPFRLGSDADKATASDKFLWVRGFGFTGLDQTAAGNLQCNGGRELRVSGINFLDMPLNIAEPDLCND